MSKPKTLAAYPEEYLHLFEKVIRERNSVTLTLADKREAESLRFDLYGFRNAAELEKYPGARAFRQLKLSVSGPELTITSPLLPGALAIFIADVDESHITPSLQEELYDSLETESESASDSEGFFSTLSDLGFISSGEKE